MKAKCSDPESGALLYAYELNILSEEDTDRFEIHYLSCNYCFKQIKSFEQEAALLSSDSEIKEIVRVFSMNETGAKAVETEGPSTAPDRFLKKLGHYLWPDTPLVFKPALAYILILAMLLPAYYGIKKSNQNTIRPVENINLTPFRSSVAIDSPSITERDIVLSFVLEGAMPGERYHIVLETEDGRKVFQDEEFSRFDRYEIGRILLPSNKMQPGGYRLVITDPRTDPPSVIQQYSFQIAR